MLLVLLQVSAEGAVSIATGDVAMVNVELSSVPCDAHTGDREDRGEWAANK